MMSPEYIESLKALEKAAHALESAKYNLKGGFISATTNRSYYACYYCIVALLYTRNVYAKLTREQGLSSQNSLLKNPSFQLKRPLLLQ